MSDHDLPPSTRKPAARVYGRRRVRGPAQLATPGHSGTKGVTIDREDFEPSSGSKRKEHSGRLERVQGRKEKDSQEGAKAKGKGKEVVKSKSGASGNKAKSSGKDRQKEDKDNAESSSSESENSDSGLSDAPDTTPQLHKFASSMIATPKPVEDTPTALPASSPTPSSNLSESPETPTKPNRLKQLKAKPTPALMIPGSSRRGRTRNGAVTYAEADSSADEEEMGGTGADKTDGAVVGTRNSKTNDPVTPGKKRKRGGIAGVQETTVADISDSPKKRRTGKDKSVLVTKKTDQKQKARENGSATSLAEGLERSPLDSPRAGREAQSSGSQVEEGLADVSMSALDDADGSEEEHEQELPTLEEIMQSSQVEREKLKQEDAAGRVGTSTGNVSSRRKRDDTKSKRKDKVEEEEASDDYDEEEALFTEARIEVL